MAYCTVQDLYNAGLDASFVNLDESIEVAQGIVDDYTGRNFEAAQSETVTVNDVRTPIVRLDRPFSNVTAIAVNGSPLDSGAYVVEPWGIRLYRAGIKDVDGFPRTEVAAGYARGPYGAQVTVTATFGYSAVPTAVKRATILLAMDDARSGGFSAQTAVDEEGQVTSLPEASGAPNDTGSVPTSWGTNATVLDTTGNVDADRLLRPYRIPMVA